MISNTTLNISINTKYSFVNLRNKKPITDYVKNKQNNRKN